MMEIFSVDPGRIEIELDVEIDMPAVAYVGIDDGHFIGSCGLAWGGGRCWLWFQTSAARRNHAIRILRHIKVLISKAKQLGETEIYAIRDTRFETSGRLMALAGFVFHGDERGKSVYLRSVNGGAHVGT